MRTLIIGSGFLGRAVATSVTNVGGSPILASRRPPQETTAPWIALDAADRDSCTRAIEGTHPDAIVLVHGPSDVTWCEDNPDRTTRVHTAAAINITTTAPGCRTVLISTDNVFNGRTWDNHEASAPDPTNAYGRAKLLAEEIIEAAPAASILRVSLVYGWERDEPDSKWLNFFASCAHRLRQGEPVQAPQDQWSTPVLVDDFAAVTVASLSTKTPTLLHLGGPQRISRADWAETIADGLGAMPLIYGGWITMASCEGRVG
ncbi:sugar nucleotide-binding protein [Streptomyces sp. ISL-86]|uniref:SDR family oxidoreductase n=1 Tax=Streptomyces sp. ISL-86 TaxID=2819187 RepID=UPI001BE6A9BF|nr:sugar nucleotide-binding protein [Streptomyces sp. ISL-86]MBT2457621.1 sugar nucleotide-binding protein [Streptomyces sp. ISL-86]